MSNTPPAEANREKRIAVIDLAEELQTRRQAIFKIIRRLGIKPSQRRESARGNQLIATITLFEAAAIRSSFRRKRATSRDGSNSSNASMTLVSDEIGVFYLLQLEPDHDPGRFKVGFTTEMDGRLRKHRCSAPFAQPVKTWPCRRTWERAAIDCTTQDCEQLHTEVFRAASIAEVVSRADSFFSVMPALNEPNDEAA